MIDLVMKLIRPLAALVFGFISIYQQKFRRLPEWYFFALEKIAIISAFELIVIKQTARGEEIFLIKRSDYDPTWPKQWHFPGTVLRYHDVKADAFTRLAEELDIEKFPSEPQLIDVTLESNDRGRHTHIFYRLDVAPEASFLTGAFFPLHDLPIDMIPYQREQLFRILDKAPRA